MFPVAATRIRTTRITELEIISSLEKYSGTSFSLPSSGKFALVFMAVVRDVFSLFFFSVSNLALASRLKKDFVCHNNPVNPCYKL